ncbi:hypothetical protein R1flu_027404 [Riccia fluitans]|uniref:Uncharacterized protein n=1 Tax=Riccia fluitans TaxID=41844 RepID=A0ABD1XLP7_9MARC
MSQKLAFVTGFVLVAVLGIGSDQAVRYYWASKKQYVCVSSLEAQILQRGPLAGVFLEAKQERSSTCLLTQEANVLAHLKVYTLFVRSREVIIPSTV